MFAKEWIPEGILGICLRPLALPQIMHLPSASQFGGDALLLFLSRASLLAICWLRWVALTLRDGERFGLFSRSVQIAVAMSSFKSMKRHVTPKGKKHGQRTGRGFCSYSTAG